MNSTIQRFFRVALSCSLLAGVGGLFASGCANAVESTVTSPEAAAPRLLRTTFLSGLDMPWDMTFTPDGALLFTEKCKGLSVRMSDGKVIRLFGTSGSKVVARDLICEGQSGVMGVTLDPAFPQNRTIYLFMSSNLTHPRTNRILRLVLDEKYSTVLKRVDIVTGLPFKEKENAWGDPGAHSGGRLRFGPDGFLYITTGDNHNGPLPQDLTRLGGKVLRVDRDGNPAPGNNTPAGGDARIYTYGHRNVQGIDFHPETGQAFIAEHGPNHSDEVTPLVAGGNGGWDPVPEQGVSCADNYCGYISNKRDGRLTPMTDYDKFPNAMRPILVNDDSQGIGPALFLRGEQWRDWNGALLIGVMAGERLEVLQLGSSGELQKKTTPDLPKQRMRAFAQGLDGSLFVMTDSGSIWRIQAR